MKFIKSFKNVLSPMLTLLVLVFISIYTLIENVGGTNIFDRLAEIMPVILVIVAVIGLQVSKQSLAAHLILLFTSYLDSGRELLLAVTSFDFQTFAFNVTWTLSLFISAIIFIYLALYVLSYVLDGKARFQLTSGPLFVSAMIAFFFFFFRDGFSGAVLKIVPPLIALSFGSELFTILLLLAGVIDVPFDVLNHLIENTLFENTLSYFLFTAFALYLIYGAISGIIKHLKS